MSPRLALLVAVAAILPLTGCNLRGSSAAPAAPAGPDLQSQIDGLKTENADLRGQIANKDKLIAEQSKAGGSLADEAKSIEGGPIEGFEPTAKGGVALPDDFAFAKGSDALNDEGEKAIARLATRLNDEANATSDVIVEGHTDHTPVVRPTTKEKFTDNWGLSGARAAAVVRALEKAGVSPKRLHGAFRGDQSPRVPVSEKSTENGGSGEAANRRVEIYLSKT